MSSLLKQLLRRCVSARTGSGLGIHVGASMGVPVNVGVSIAVDAGVRIHGAAVAPAAALAALPSAEQE